MASRSVVVTNWGHWCSTSMALAGSRPIGPLRVLLAVAAVAVLVGCGATTGTTSASSPTPDIASAKQAALGLFVADPSTTNHWIACSNVDNWAACPLSTTVKARLADLTSKGYFGDVGGCGEEYISGTQNGFNNAPQALSAVAGADGGVTVVIQRSTANPRSPNLTSVMTLEGGKWLASDLASGTGANASIFAAKPNC